MTFAEERIQELCEAAAKQPLQFNATQRLWSRAFIAAHDAPSAVAEFTLLQASFPACFPIAGWYDYFSKRAGQLLEDADINQLSAMDVSVLQRLQKRMQVFAGHFKSADTRIQWRNLTHCTKSITIGVDIRPLLIPSSRKRGIGRYLMSTLPRLYKQGLAHRFVLLYDCGTVLDDALLSALSADNVSAREFGAGCDYDLDVFLLTDPVPMLSGRRLAELPIVRCPWVSIIYDFIPLEYPELYLRGCDALTDEYIENLEVLGARSQTVFPISNYVAEQCKQFLGHASERVMPILGGVDDEFFRKPSSDAVNIIDAPYFLYVGGADARKNLVGLIRAFDRALDKLPVGCKLVLVGEMNEQRAASLLSQLSLDHLRGRVIGLGGIDDDLLCKLYRNALATVFVSFSEGLGLPALEAMAGGCPVLASNTTALAETVGDAAMVVDPSSCEEIAEALVRLASDEKLRSELAERGPKHALKWKWDDVASKLLHGITNSDYAPVSSFRTVRRLRVAMVNRENVWSAPGGDSRVMQQMQAAAATLGIDVYFPTMLEDAASADIIHFVNMTLPRPLAQAASFAVKHDKPFVITTLYEDWPLYLNASHQAFGLYRAFKEGKVSFANLKDALNKLSLAQHAPKVDVHDSIHAANLLLSCAESEATRIQADYNLGTNYIRVVPFEVAVPSPTETRTVESLKNALSLDQFILCIGRLETRKNQLALLAALHDSDTPIVFATGDYTPQPAYSTLVRSWKRRAPVKFVERMPWHLMSALIRSASAHVLPSFYELPGLVHLECAAAGVPIVASDWGALNDYLPDNLYYRCDPLDLDSIRDAVERALHGVTAPAPAVIAQSYSQERLARGLSDAYETALSIDRINKRENTQSVHRRFQPKVTGGIYATV